MPVPWDPMPNEFVERNQTTNIIVEIKVLLELTKSCRQKIVST
jgi:hypothetical protein